MKPCYWCPEPAVRETELEPPVYGSRVKEEYAPGGAVVERKIRVLTRPAIKAWVCEAHDEMVERNRRERERIKEEARELRRQKREAT